jgi:hypothetical protein
MEPEVWTKEKYLEIRERVFADGYTMEPAEWECYKASNERWENECPWSEALIEKRKRAWELSRARDKARRDAAQELYWKLDETELLAFFADEKQSDEMREALIEEGPLPETVFDLVFEKDWRKAQEAAFFSQNLEERHLRRIEADKRWCRSDRARASELIQNLHLRAGRPSSREEWANRHKLVQKLLEICGEFEIAAKVRNDTEKRRRA